MKITLNQSLVLRLTLMEKPINHKNGKLVYESNEKLHPYILYDDHSNSPTGFGVKVSKTKKTYLIQRRVSSNKVIKAKVGNVSDFTNIDVARNKARELVQIANASKRNPNNINREKDANDITLMDSFTEYRVHLTGKPKPVKKNTLLVLDRAFNKLTEWHNKRIKDITGKEIIAKFDSIANLHRTSAEQTFRWANAAINFSIKTENDNAQEQQREPYLNYNPFQVLTTNQKFRTRSQLQESYKSKGIRKPLSISDSLGKWLITISKKRPHNRTGCDYLLLTTLWGTRKSEALDLKWRNKIDRAEELRSSWVDLKRKIVHFYDTKNRTDLDLPIADAAYEILKQRYELSIGVRASQEKWVFPAESKHSKVGHYSSMKSLVKNICIDANITHIGTHDLRRTFGRVAEQLVSYGVVKALLNHQTLSDVTSIYTEVEPDRLLDAMQKIELHILQTAPSVYNLLLTPKRPPLPLSEQQIEKSIINLTGSI